ncbi:MAG: chemotaxis protein CheW [Proteobacteria bacterium]|nr:chemotaxis protein CheW [Pseudomonadota bacterium]
MPNHSLKLRRLPADGYSEQEDRRLLRDEPLWTKDDEVTMNQAAPKASPPPTSQPISTAPLDSKSSPPGGAAPTGDPTTDTIRVQVVLLDKLMNLAGELVLIRNQVVQHASTAGQSGDFLNLAQRLSILTSELQSEVMKARMQPIGNILTKLSRIVRDGARDLNKSIDVHIEGAETELDKTLIESIKDPLTHLVRNAVDHGIELPEERKKAGKPETGSLKVQAYHEGGQVIVEISDDGQGLKRAKIGAKAVERGLITAQALETMSDRDVHQLIFAPGLSTADKVSSLSGRGVGMDVVRTNIEKIGGVVDLVSTEGVGTTIRLKIPLTLAIIPALIVRAGGERFAIPQIKLVELVRVEPADDGSGPHIEMLQGQPVFRLRGELLPLICLNETLQEATPRDAASFKQVTNIVVLNADKSLFGLIVDEIEDSIDIVVKPLSNFLKSLNTYTGATVMGDGTIALALDVLGLAERVRLLNGEGISQDKAEGTTVQDSLKDRVDYILLDIGAPGMYSVPLKQVKRLEEPRASTIETAGEQRVVRYRDLILPIVTVCNKLGLQAANPMENHDPNRSVLIVVVEQDDRMFGLEVQRILDIFSTQLPIDKRATDRPGILGSMIVEQTIVGVIDVGAVIGV